MSFCGIPVGGSGELVFICEENPVAGNSSAGSDEDTAPQNEPPDMKDSLVNLNTAGKEELVTLNGIGESRAEAILEYRREKGAFTAIEDIMQVPGIKEGIFSKIKDQITVH